MKSKKVHDPFHDDEPQISSVYDYTQPDEIDGIDHSHGGRNVPPRVMTDPNFRSGFKKEKEHNLDPDYSKGKK